MLGNILAVGLMSMGIGLTGVKDEPQMYAENAETYTITYNAEDWEEKAQAVYDWLEENNYKSSSTALSISGTLKITGQNDATLNGLYAEADRVTMNVSGTPSYVWITTSNQLKSANEITTYTLEEISITSQTYYEALKEPSMGNDIVGTIASGLGIIGALATTFLTGFGNLFYSSGALTPFAIFALVMLGIAISFAVVKLVLNLIRSNTGA